MQRWRRNRKERWKRFLHLKTRWHTKRKNTIIIWWAVGGTVNYYKRLSAAVENIVSGHIVLAFFFVCVWEILYILYISTLCMSIWQLRVFITAVGADGLKCEASFYCTTSHWFHPNGCQLGVKVWHFHTFNQRGLCLKGCYQKPGKKIGWQRMRN